MRAALLLLALLAAPGCRTLRPGPAPDVVTAEELQVDFPRVGEGSLDVLVPLPAGLAQVSRVTWTLRVRGIAFATGVEGPPFRVEGAQHDERHLRLRVPLLVKHLAWREGSGFLQVGVEGVLEGRALERDVRVPFAARREVLVQNVPRVGEGED